MQDEIQISLALPTRGRVDLVRRLLDSMADTAEAPGRLEVLLYLDEDDTPSHEIEHAAIRLKKLVRSPATMGRMTRACYEAANGRHVMLMNDDVVCRTPAWDSATLRALDSFSDGIALVWCNDLMRGASLCTLPALPRAACELTGGVCPPDYRRDYIDSHLFDIFIKLKELGHDRMLYLDDVVLEHCHFEAGKAEFDATYVKPRMFMDELMYIAWDERRRLMAEAMARRIEGAG